METINYTTAIMWYAMWPVVIFVAYKFVLTNVEHLEENLENNLKEKPKDK